MPDGYGDGHVDRYDDYHVRKSVQDIRWALADHLRYDHGKPMHAIAKATGLSFKEVKERYK